TSHTRPTPFPYPTLFRSDKDPEMAKWLSTRDFRIALSHGIDRTQINETFVLGLGQVASAAPGDRTPYFPGPEYKRLHVGYDVKKIGTAHLCTPVTHQYPI